MDKGVVFWILMILWAVFGLWYHVNPGTPYGWVGNTLLLFLLFFLLGWHDFGFVIR